MPNVCYSMNIPSTRYATLSAIANRDLLILIRPSGYRSDSSVSSTFSRTLRPSEQDYTLHQGLLPVVAGTSYPCFNLHLANLGSDSWSTKQRYLCRALPYPLECRPSLPDFFHSRP